jgi:hypothetical protein
MPEGDQTGPRGEGPRTGRRGLEDRLGVMDSLGSSLESLVSGIKELPGLIKKTAYYTYYTCKAALGLSAGVAIAGAYPVYAAKAPFTAASIFKAGYSSLILPVGMAIGTWLSNIITKTKTTFKQIFDDLAIGGLLGGVLSYIFLGNDRLVNVVKSSSGALPSLITGGAYSLATLPAFLSVHETLNRAFISDYKPKPFKSMFNQVKKMWPIMLPLVANYSVIPEYLGPAYQMPVAAGISAAYGALKSEKKEEKKEEPSQADLERALQNYRPAA